MTNVSAIQALQAALTASDQVSQQSDVDFSSYLKTSKTLDEIYQEASQTYGVSEELLKAMTKQESSFRTNATSRSGAQGLMQLMPATARSLGVTDSYDPYQNIMGGAKYIRQMLDKYNGDVSLALAAYNAGSNNVDKYGGIPPFAETQNYVAKITQYLSEGVEVPDQETHYMVGEATVTGDTDITYQDLNEFAGEILTNIFSYEDYMKVLATLVGKDNETMALSFHVVSNGEKENEEQVTDSYKAYQDLTTAPARTFLVNGGEIV